MTPLYIEYDLVLSCVIPESPASSSSSRLGKSAAKDSGVHSFSRSSPSNARDSVLPQMLLPPQLLAATTAAAAALLSLADSASAVPLWTRDNGGLYDCLWNAGLSPVTTSSSNYAGDSGEFHFRLDRER